MEPTIERWYSMKEICEYLGVSRDTVLARKENRKMPAAPWFWKERPRAAQALRGALTERERQSARDTRLVTTLCFSLSLLVTILLI